MAVISLVLDKPLGENNEGDVIQVEQEVGDTLIQAGLAHEASHDEVNGSDDASEGDASEAAPSADDNFGKSADYEKQVEKAAEKAVEKITKEASYKRPSVKVNKSWTVDSYEKTGGFKSFGSFVQCAIASYNNDPSAQRKMGEYSRKGQMSTTVNTGGGYLVPQQWANEIWQLTFSGGPDFLSMMNKYEMNTKTIHIPEFNITSGASGVTASWTNETSAITDTVPLTNEIQLTLSKLAVLVNVTDEQLRFTPQNIESQIRQHVPSKVRFKFNDGIMNGTGSQVGLIGNAAAVNVARAVANRVTYPDIVKMWTALYGDFESEAVWVGNRTILPELLTMAFPSSSGTVPAYMPIGNNFSGGQGNLAYAPSGMLLGRPIYFCEQSAALGSTGDLALVHFKSIACGYLPMDEAQTNALYFDKAIDTFRFLFYVATKNQMLSPYTRADSSTASNIVCLDDPA
jgi:HK97 family phage major capsid protein